MNFQCGDHSNLRKSIRYDEGIVIERYKKQINCSKLNIPDHPQRNYSTETKIIITRLKFAQDRRFIWCVKVTGIYRQVCRKN